MPSNVKLVSDIKLSVGIELSIMPRAGAGCGSRKLTQLSEVVMMKSIHCLKHDHLISLRQICGATLLAGFLGNPYSLTNIIRQQMICWA
jgi:hypothetical protein